ncbi:unnamed protein product [Ilex paraguariensis]|uniref:Ubiquitin-like protease family profile domain-containing protein n=1 Tax=Ilex paraguariensis TaxID=185542 RepID=A0ABC8T155_9AQUA
MRTRTSSSSETKFSVFEFNEDDELVERTSEKMLCKFKKRKDSEPPVVSPFDKYKFLQCFAQETNTQQKGCRNEPLDVDASDDVVEGRICGLDVIPSCSSSNYKPTSHCRSSYVESGRFFSEANSIMPRALNLGVASSTELIGINSDDDEGIELSSSSTSSSEFAESEGPLDERKLEHGFFGCDIGTVVDVSPDYIIYGDMYSPNSLLTFSCSCIKIKGSAGCGIKGPFSFEWKIADVENIESMWCESVKTAAVNLHLKSKDTKAAGNANISSGISELKFAVYDPQWYEREEAIKSLNKRYNSIWRVVMDIDTVRSKGASLGQNNIFSSKHYFANFDEPFEDVIYPKGDPDAVSISKRDVMLLKPETFINDTIIDFYMKYLKSKINPKEKHRFHFVNSFFFRKMADLDKDPSTACEGRAAFQRVRKWTRKVNLFEKDYIFIPVNFSLHWSLLVICHPGEVAEIEDEEMEKSSKVPCILHMDSIKGSHRGLKNLIRSYLWEEWKERHNELVEDVSTKFLNLQFVPLENLLAMSLVIWSIVFAVAIPNPLLPHIPKLGSGINTCSMVSSPLSTLKHLRNDVKIDKKVLIVEVDEEFRGDAIKIIERTPYASFSISMSLDENPVEAFGALELFLSKEIGMVKLSKWIPESNSAGDRNEYTRQKVEDDEVARVQTRGNQEWKVVYRSNALKERRDKFGLINSTLIPGIGQYINEGGAMIMGSVKGNLELVGGNSNFELDTEVINDNKDSIMEINDVGNDVEDVVETVTRRYWGLKRRSDRKRMSMEMMGLTHQPYHNDSNWFEMGFPLGFDDCMDDDSYIVELGWVRRNPVVLPISTNLKGGGVNAVVLGGPDGFSSSVHVNNVLMGYGKVVGSDVLEEQKDDCDLLICIENDGLPQQENSFDCGLFLLHYAELFLEQAPVNFSLFRISKSSNFIKKDWFLAEEVSHKRAHITQLIYEIVENNTQKIRPSACGEKYSLELPDTAEGDTDVEFLHEICNSPKACRDSCFNSNDQEANITPLAATLREGGSPIDGNYQRIGQMVSTNRFKNVMSPIEEAEETGEQTTAMLTNKAGRSQMAEVTESSTRPCSAIDLTPIYIDTEEYEKSDRSAEKSLGRTLILLDIQNEEDHSSPKELLAFNLEREREKYEYSSTSTDDLATCIIQDSEEENVIHDVCESENTPSLPGGTFALFNQEAEFIEETDCKGNIMLPVSKLEKQQAGKRLRLIRLEGRRRFTRSPLEDVG